MAESKTEEAPFSPTKRFLRLLAVDRKEISYLYVYAIFNGLVNLTLPLGIQAIITLLGSAQLSTSWGLLIAVVIIGVAATGALQIMQLVITETLQRRVFTRSAFEFAFRIPRIKMEALSRTYLPELMNRFFDTLSVQKGFSKLLIDFSSSALQILFGLILLSFYHPLFILFSLLLVALLTIIFTITGPKGLKTSIIESKYKYEVAHWLEELARAMGTFKLAGESNLPLGKTDELVTNYLEARKSHFRVLITQYGFIVLFKTVITAGLLLLGSFLVASQEINIGQFVASEIVIILVIAAAEKLILSMETIYDVLTAVEKLGSVTDLPLEKDYGIFFNEVDTGKGMKISMQDISYKYPDSGKPALTNINLEIEPGEKICIAGFNGSGKSTLLQMIAGLYSEYLGHISYNDIPLANFCIHSLRQQIGDNLAQEGLFKATLEENITLGRNGLGLKDVMWATDKLDLTNFIKSLDNGYHTMIDPEGGRLPRSVVRRLIMARSVVEKPRLLLVEDSLNQLEMLQKDKVSAFITNKDMDWTLVVVTNDPLMASRCDRILIMEDGKIIDQGSFIDISNKSYYSTLFNASPW